MHLAQDPGFVQQYDRVMAWFAAEQQPGNTWFAQRYAGLGSRPVAYFCAEFGLHNSVPIYSGGLGVLAGDHCKSASDLGVPLVGVGLSYMKGYFDQKLRGDGWQEDSDDQVDPSLTPLQELRGRLVGLLQAPATKIARLVSEPGAQLARALAARGRQEG